MFIVVSSGGSHDEAWESTEVCSSDKDKLELYIADRKAAIAKERDFQSRLHELYVDFATKNPKRAGTIVRYDKPKWASGIGQHQITQAMKDERAAWQANYDAYMAELNSIEQDWIHNLWKPVYFKFLTDEGRPLPEVFSMETGRTYFEDVYFEINEIPEL